MTEKNNEKRKVIFYLAAYTLLFAAVFLLAYRSFLVNGKTFIISGDGREQNYPVLIYIGQRIRRMIEAACKGSFEFPMFDLSVGMGGDLISTLTYHGLTDPLNLLSAAVPVRYTENLFNFLCIFRCYLAGISFFALCRHHKKPLSHTLVGSLVYTFSGWAIYTAVRHPWMINPMIQMPLLLIGADLIIQRQRPFVFVLSVGYSALCGFYGLYVMTVLLGIYLLAYLAVEQKREPLRTKAKEIVRIAAAYLWGAGLAAVSLVPSVIGVLTCGRGGQVTERNYLSYGLNYYRNALSGLISPPGSWDTLSLAAMILPALVLLFLCTKKRLLKVLAVIAAVIYVVPAGGYMMNGFAYPVQRWTFAAALLLAFLLVEMLPMLCNLNRKQKEICLAVLLLFALLVFAVPKNRTTYQIVGCAMLAVTTAALFCLNDLCLNDRREPGVCVCRKPGAERYQIILCLLVVIGNISINADYRFGPQGANYISYFADRGEETKRLFQTPEKLLETFPRKRDGRVESSSFSYNTGLVFQVPTDFSYWSVTNGNVVEFWEKTESISQRAMKFRIGGTDQRTVLSTLFSTKYFTEAGNREQYLPFGYQRIGNLPDGYGLYENRYALPWGYTYDSYITYDELNRLSGPEYEEALIQTVALDHEINDMAHGTVRTSVREVPFEITRTDHLSWENGVLRADKENAAMTIHFEPVRNEELYVRLRGLDINGSGYSEMIFTVRTGDVSKNAGTASTLFNVYSERENYLFNLNYSETERDTCTLICPKPGTFKLGDIQVLAVPMDGYVECVNALRREPLENIEWGTNSLTGDIKLSDNKILCISIPYSTGWKASVDGEKTDILRGNTMFLAIPLQRGTHKIELSYRTPGISGGFLISALSWILLLNGWLYERKRKREGL